MIQQKYEKRTGSTWLHSDSGHSVVVYKLGKSWNARLGGHGGQVSVRQTKKAAIARGVQYLENIEKGE
tara:strand:+ start:104 stop:307 length:204 start_codon:yes stop_codon:yes gene_type:complete